MSVPSLADLFQMPSARRLLSALIDDLAQRRSLLVLLPNGIGPTEIWSMLRTELWRDFAFKEVPLPADRTPIAALSDALAIKWTSPEMPRTIANLMSFEDLPDVVALEGFDALPSASCREWVAFLAQWAQVSQNVADRGHVSTALCMIAPAADVLPHVPESSVRLGVHWWWKIPSVLETHLLCRLGNEGDSWSTEGRWREHLLPTLAGNDVSMIEYLWDDLHLSIQDLTGRLRSFAEQRGWTAETLRDWGADALPVPPNHEHGPEISSPPAQFVELWAHGALCWTLEYGLELHAGALAVLGRNEELKHRLWRGQAGLLLPIIDHVRLTVCGHLTELYGPDWPVRWHQPSSPAETTALQNCPLACEWGHLERLLKTCAHLRSEKRWLPLTSKARQIRNKMAHYQPVDFHDFAGLWRTIQQLA